VAAISRTCCRRWPASNFHYQNMRPRRTPSTVTGRIVLASYIKRQVKNASKRGQSTTALRSLIAFNCASLAFTNEYWLCLAMWVDLRF